MSLSVKLPIRETAKVSSVKLAMRETALVITGFFMRENIVTLLSREITLIEVLKSRILLTASLVDKNHIMLKWYGEKVPKVLIFDKLDGEDFTTTPKYTVNWTPQEFLMAIDGNGHDYKIQGLSGTGESNVISIGENKEYAVDCTVELPINEKNFFFNIHYMSEYKIGVHY